jgi:hypothetical protein
LAAPNIPLNPSQTKISNSDLYKFANPKTRSANLGDRSHHILGKDALRDTGKQIPYNILRHWTFLRMVMIENQLSQKITPASDGGS